jgi:hypothetical protein
MSIINFMEKISIAVLLKLQYDHRYSANLIRGFSWALLWEIDCIKQFVQ